MKIFCIGLNKTATTSLSNSWKILGYDKICSPMRLNNLDVSMAAFEGKYKMIFDLIDNYDCFKDRPFNTNKLYRMLDNHVPDSKFILTVRDTEEWWDSVSRWLTNRNGRRFDSETDKLLRIEIYKRHFETNEFTKESFVKYYEEYNNEVREYFKGNPNFLEMNICGGDSWELLCPFLGKEIPNKPFPMANVNK